MAEIKALMTSPYTWFTLGVGAMLGVWWTKLTPVTANFTLAIGVVALTASVFLFPWISAQPIVIRTIWSLAAFSTLCLAVYYTLWTTTVPVELSATTSSAVQPAGATIGGVTWSSHYTEIRVFLYNNSKIDYRDFDFVVRADQAVVAAGQVTNLSNVSIEFHDLPAISPETVDTGTGQRFAEQFIPIASTLGFRVRCAVLPRLSHLELVLAGVTMHDGQTNIDLDKLLRVNFSDGASVWFGRHGYSDQVFGSKPIVTRVSVEGQYVADERPVTLNESLPVIDRMAVVLPDLQQRSQQR